MELKGKAKRYPFYMYHKDEDEPRRVDDHEQEVALENKGWITRYIHKDYPKWVNGVIVKSKEEHDKLIEADDWRGPVDEPPIEEPKVTKVTLEENPDGTGEPILTPVCDVCGRVCKSKAGLMAHMTKHKEK